MLYPKQYTCLLYTSVFVSNITYVHVEVIVNKCGTLHALCLHNTLGVFRHVFQTLVDYSVYIQGIIPLSLNTKAPLLKRTVHFWISDINVHYCYLLFSVKWLLCISYWYTVDTLALIECYSVVSWTIFSLKNYIRVSLFMVNNGKQNGT